MTKLSNNKSSIWNFRMFSCSTVLPPVFSFHIRRPKQARSEKKTCVVKTYRLGLGDLTHRTVHQVLQSSLSSKTKNQQAYTHGTQTLICTAFIFYQVVSNQERVHRNLQTTANAKPVHIRNDLSTHRSPYLQQSWCPPPAVRADGTKQKIQYDCACYKKKSLKWYISWTIFISSQLWIKKDLKHAACISL